MCFNDIYIFCSSDYDDIKIGWGALIAFIAIEYNIPMETHLELKVSNLLIIAAKSLH